MDVSIRQATTQDLETVSGILLEAAHWLNDTGKPMWREEEIVPERISSDVSAGVFFLAECDGEAAGTVKFQLEDMVVWFDIPQHDSAFVHRLAVRRKFAGGAVSTAILRWAVEQTRLLGRRYLRLDCAATRPRLRAIYEQFGFTHHSNKQIGPYFDARYEYDVSEHAPRP
jgi:GNAT superfamily N-acetyltransferase